MRRLWIEAIESIRIAVEQVMVHKLRSMLTALGVIIGIVAVTLMGTAIKGVDTGFQQTLDLIGTDLFYVERRPWDSNGQEWWHFRNREPIREQEAAERFNELLNQTPNSNLVVAVPKAQTWRNFRFEERLIEGVQITGTNPEFSVVSNSEISEGRFFTNTEAMSGRNVVVLGFDVAEALFPDRSPVGEEVVVAQRRYEVIGVMERMGSFLGLFSLDNQAVIPLNSLRKWYRRGRDNGLIIQMRPDADKTLAEDEIVGHMRLVRQIMPGHDNDFSVNKTETLEQELGPVKLGIAVAGLGITGLSLFVGAIGIMNITFVSVKERTREIGTRRALGARQRTILFQFLVEAVMICLLGGLIGLALTFGLFQILKGAIPAFPLVFSPDLVLFAFAVCILAGVLSGFAPALMASRLDPAEALRHE